MNTGSSASDIVYMKREGLQGGCCAADWLEKSGSWVLEYATTSDIWKCGLR